MFQAITGLGAAFGLAGSAGLNAYIPLLMVAVAAHYPLNNPLVKLAEPYDMLGSPWAIALLSVLLVIEMTVDKVPAIDSLNDILQTFIRPAAGAFLFAASANVITDISPVLTIAAGILVAGGVHATKVIARPAVTATTAGTGNWLVSLIEDITAFAISLMAILLPLLAGMFVLAVGVLVLVIWRRRRRKKQELAFN